MTATPTTSLRELDHRGNDGIDVRLLWDARTDTGLACRGGRALG